MGQLKLTPTEQRILEVLARRPGRVVTRDLILDTLYAGADAPRSSTVDVFVHGLRRKLDGDTGLRIETVRGAGFRLAIA
jgi:DNA-binding response OmpR family regulator